MSTGRKILIVLCMVGIFAAGGATGVFVTLRFVRHHGPVDRFVGRQLDKMTRDLELTPEQHEQVEKILRDGTEQLSALRHESIRQGAAKIREMNEKIAAVLNPDQKAKFEEFLKKQRERIRRFQQERAERHGPQGGPPDGNGDEPPPPPPSSNP